MYPIRVAVFASVALLVCSMAPTAYGASPRSPKPRHVWPSWNGGFVDGVPGRGANRWGTLSKVLAWDVSSIQNVAKFNVYEKHPGDAAFRLTRTIDLSPLAACNGGICVDSQYTDPYTGFYTSLGIKPRNGAWVQIMEHRRIEAWPVGTYEQQVAAVNAQGVEGPRSDTVSCTYLGLGQILQPHPGDVTTIHPVVSWTDPALQLNLRGMRRRYSHIFLWGGSWGTVPAMEQTWFSGETATTFFTENSGLIPGEQFHVAHMTFVDPRNPTHCPCISISFPVSFTIQ